MNIKMYEEKRSEQSTQNLSYASVDIKEEYSRKLNELELEKEELEYYKRKYKRKVEKLNQEKRNYRNKISEIIRRATPKNTEESLSEDSFDAGQLGTALLSLNDEPQETRICKEKALLRQEKEALIHLKGQIEIDLARLRREKIKMSLMRKVVGRSQGKLSDLGKFMDIGRIPDIGKSISEEKLSRYSSKLLSD